jgi:hypothetical protein
VALESGGPASDILQPVIRYAPIGEIKIYEISEHELEALEQGSPDSTALNAACALLPFGVSLFITLRTATIASHVAIDSLAVGSALSIIAGIACVVIFWRTPKKSRTIIQSIRDRMPPPPGTQISPKE